MYVDHHLELSDAQAVTNDAASTNFIDQQAACRAYEEPWLVVQVVETFDTAAEGGTLTVKLQTDDNADFSSATDVFTSQQFAEAQLTAGAVLLKMRLPLGLKRYLRLYYDVNNADPFTAGKLDAFITTDVEMRW